MATSAPIAVPAIAHPDAPATAGATAATEATALSAPEIVNPPPAVSEPAAAAPAEADEPETTVPGWGTLKASHPLLKFHARLPSILETAGHKQIWGITLDPTTPTFSTLLILQKYLRSVSDDVEAAIAALTKTLTWRREFGLDGEKPIWEEHFEGFDGLGYVTHLSGGEVVTWNLYGSVKDLGATFGNLDKFLRWRIALMERALSHLNLAHTTACIPDCGAGVDPHRLAQVHVYSGVSFLRLDPRVKVASRKAIEIMAAHYPETLSRKLFVGVPLIMSWVFAAVKLFVSAATARKFVVVSYEENTAGELGDLSVPARFGGSGPELPELDRAAQEAECKGGQVGNGAANGAASGAEKVAEVAAEGKVEA